jgi:hypothetical protein
MEGNDCYKFSTIRNFIAGSQGKDVDTIVEIGANIGEVTLLMHAYFPAAKIIALEAVKEYCDIAAARTRKIQNVAVHNKAVTAQHRFLDDLGEQRRGQDIDLVILKGLPDGGPGWVGGSIVFPRDEQRVANPDDHYGYLKIDQAVTPITLAEIMAQEDLTAIDILKLDCEGCEHRFWAPPTRICSNAYVSSSANITASTASRRSCATSCSRLTRSTSSATRSSAASSPNAATKAATASCTTAGCQCRCRG